jgi:hypothetical protein
MLLDWFVFAVVGRLLVFLGQKFPLPQALAKYEKIKELHACPLCLGVWIYSALAYFMGMDFLADMGFWYIPVISEVVTGGAISFVVFIFGIGWKDYFAPEIVV